jgi:hypothetical protein
MAHTQPALSPNNRPRQSNSWKPIPNITAKPQKAISVAKIFKGEGGLLSSAAASNVVNGGYTKNNSAATAAGINSAAAIFP